MKNKDYNEYFKYLKGRSFKAHLYLNFYLYPLLTRYLNGKVIDVGCGTGDFLRYRKETIGVDVNPYNVEYCRELGLDSHLIGESGTFPFDDACFQGAILDNVLEHIEDPTLTIDEINRMLAPGGILIVGVPGQRGFSHDSDHKKFYDEVSLIRLMRHFGFIKKRVIHMPLFKSAWLSKKVRQYCIYAVFQKNSRVSSDHNE